MDGTIKQLRKKVPFRNLCSQNRTEAKPTEERQTFNTKVKRSRILRKTSPRPKTAKGLALQKIFKEK